MKKRTVFQKAMEDVTPLVRIRKGTSKINVKKTTVRLQPTKEDIRALRWLIYG